MNFSANIEEYLGRLRRAADLLDRNEVNTFINILLDAHRRQSNIFIFGNGGSALTASHFAGDLNKGVSFGMNKKFKVIALTDNLATIMAFANDVSYDEIFIEQLKNFISEGDVVIGISGSGNSKNVLRAIEYANSCGNTTVGLTGYNGGVLKKIAAHSVNANINDMQVSEDIHVIVCHLAMSVINEYFRSIIQ
jgi:D-sedoheptulose 7-phosphate isomerase